MASAGATRGGDGDTLWERKLLAEQLEQPNPNGEVPSGHRTDTEQAYEERVQANLDNLRVREEARERLHEEKARERLHLPEDPGSLIEQRDNLPKRPPHRIESLLPKGGNALVVAEFGTGKTTLTGNLTRALADGEDFLGQLSVEQPDGNIALFNLEMDPLTYCYWLLDMGIRNMERVFPYHLRGFRLPLTSDVAAEGVRDLLRKWEIEVWVIDPWRRLIASEPDSDGENGNDIAGRITERIDQIKQEAGVSEAIIPAHTGRGQEEGKEHVRGATALEDWADAEWVYNKNAAGTRFLRTAKGRDAYLNKTKVNYDEATRRLTLESEDQREERQVSEKRQKYLAALAAARDKPGITKSSLLRTRGIGHTQDAPKLIEELLSMDYLSVEGKGQAQHHHLTNKGQKYLESKASRQSKEDEED